MSKVIKFTSKNLDSDIYAKRIKDYVFGMYSHKMVYEDGTWREQWFIALKHRSTGVVLELTPYSKYLRFIGKNKTVDFRRPETIRVRGYFICLFLNHVLINRYEEYKVTNVKNLTIDIANRFLQAYSNGEVSKDKRRKPKDTVERVAIEVAKFYIWIQNIFREKAKHIKGINMIERIEYTDMNGKKDFRSVTPFKVHVSQVTKEEVFRDIPNKALYMLINISLECYPEMTLGICLQAFAGLRIGEVCNIRQEICPIDGGGVTYEKIGGTLASFKINIRNKYPMRSDGIDVGGIKKYRIQAVYTPFLRMLGPIYKRHKEWLETQYIEKGYYPMLINNKGLAETTQNYREKFKRLVNDHFIPALVKSNDYELKIYGELLLTRELTPHALRHWFTVQLVLNNEPLHSIASWRGDSDLNSALVYLQNKSELMKMYKTVTADLLQDIKGFGTRYVSENNDL